MDVDPNLFAKKLQASSEVPEKMIIYIFFLDLDFLYTFNDYPYIFFGYYVHF